MSDSSKQYFKQKENVELLRQVNNKLNLYLKDCDKFGYVIGNTEKHMVERIENKIKEIKKYYD